MPVIMVPGNADICPECGCVVTYNAKQKHAEWHAKLNRK